MDEKIQPYSEEHIYVICDLKVPLNMYRLDEPFISRITAKFPNINLIFTSPETIFDDANQNPLFKKATIYLGNLFNMEYIKLIPGLKWIHLCSVGRDKVNAELVKEKNISVTSSGGIPNNPMVASAIAFMSNMARGVFRSHILKQYKQLDRKNWDKTGDFIQDMYGQHVLIVGYGSIGSELAKICKAFDMKVSAINRSHLPDNNVDYYYTLDNISTCINDADFVVNLLPLTTETFQFFTKKIFNKMNRKSFFVSLGRGETVSEEDLILALKNKTICAAALDVFEIEPLPLNSPLWDIENLIITPHVASYSNTYWDKQSNLFIDLLDDHLTK